MTKALIIHRHQQNPVGVPCGLRTSHSDGQGSTTGTSSDNVPAIADDVQVEDLHFVPRTVEIKPSDVGWIVILVTLVLHR